MSIRQGIGLQSSIRSPTGYLEPRVWGFGSRRAVSETLYFGLQYGMFLSEYGERFGAFQLSSEQQEQSVLLSTFIYGGLGITATVATAIGAAATGQFAYTGLALMALPLQVDTFFKNLSAIEKAGNVRRYFERRREIISRGLH